jgi:hypothetical protein
MEFIENHFYKLTKEIPVKQLFQMPSWYNGAAYYSYYGNSNMYGYGSYTISTYDSNGNMIISNVSPYEASKRFTLGRIYQAFSKTALYDDMGSMYSLDGNEIECFEEVEIGLNEISKKFMEKQINSGKMTFQFNFFLNDMVVLKMTLNGKHSTCVSLMGVMEQVNEMLHNAYIALRKSYINKVKNNIETSYKWSTLMGGNQYIYDIETRGVFGGRL